MLYLKRGCSSGCGLSWEMGGEDEDVTVSSSTDDVTIVTCGGEMSDCSVLVVMDTESPVGPQSGRGGGRGERASETVHPHHTITRASQQVAT